MALLDSVAGYERVRASLAAALRRLLERYVEQGANPRCSTYVRVFFRAVKAKRSRALRSLDGVRSAGGPATRFSGYTMTRCH